MEVLAAITAEGPYPIVASMRCGCQSLYWWRLDSLAEGAAHETSAGSTTGTGDGRVWGRE